MRKLFMAAAIAALPAAAMATTHAGSGKTIVATAVATPDLSTLVTAVKAAGLVETLSGKGPFTVFAPTNAAFAKLPPGMLNTLTQPANKGALTAILTYHVVPGNVSAKQLTQLIGAGKGSATLKTVNGQSLTARIVGGKVVLTDANGGTSTVTATDVKASNGVVHVIDTVVTPRRGA